MTCVYGNVNATLLNLFSEKLTNGGENKGRHDTLSEMIRADGGRKSLLINSFRTLICSEDLLKQEFDLIQCAFFFFFNPLERSAPFGLDLCSFQVLKLSLFLCCSAHFPSFRFKMTTRELPAEERVLI